MSLALLFFVAHSTPLAAQLLGAIPPLPPVVVTRTDDGLTAKIGDETLRVSVCSASVIHVVATPRSPESIRHDQPWMLDPKQSCPGAQFQFSQADDTAVLTTATLKVELSLKRGNLKYSSIGGPDLLREGDAVPRTYEPAQVNGENTLPRRGSFSARCHGRVLWSGPAPERNVQLPRQHGRARAEQHRCRHSPAGLEQGLRVALEHRVLYATQTTGFRWNSRSARWPATRSITT